MPILNLSKAKKAEGGDVPDELPSLPDDKSGAKPEEKKEETQPEAAPAEQAQPAQEGAPDELPSLQEEPSEEDKTAHDEAAAHEALKDLAAPAKPAPTAHDKRLYFSNLIKRVNEGVGIDEIKNEIQNSDVIQKLHEQTTVNKKEDDSNVITDDIKTMMADLMILEKEWAVLKREIETKTTQFHDTEKKIREYSDLIKQKFSDMDHVKQG